jgi:acyl-CoA reductase-like NAD-dependent aldehyde dehydrogenase
MTTTATGAVTLTHGERFFIGGVWVQPRSDDTIDVVKPGVRFGGFKQSGIGPRAVSWPGGYLETKIMILDDLPASLKNLA